MHHAARPAPDGLVRLAGRPLMLLALVALAGGVAGGLLRLGLLATGGEAASSLGPAADWHAALMICAFFGTVIAVERAVALRAAWAWAGPSASGCSGLALLLGNAAVARSGFLLAAVAFVLVNIAIVRRQAALHTALLLVAALAWWAGALLDALQVGQAAVLPLWFSFLILTIAAERLEMTRLMRQRAGARPALLAVIALLIGGALLAAAAPRAGPTLFGAALISLAAWLALHDVARRTVHTPGLPRYIAVCLLLGYGWLAVGGVAWLALSLGFAPARDTALHALGLGFVFGLVMAHAPVILPAVARLKLQFGAWFYAPVIALHASLLMRLAGGLAQPGLRAAGGALDAAAMLLFLLTLAGAAIAWRRIHPK